MKKKLMSFTLALIMVAPISATSANALKIIKEDNESVIFLDEFLCNLKNGDINQAFCVMNDERSSLREDIDISTLTSEQKATVEYVESGNAFADEYVKEAIKDYEILNVVSDGVITVALDFQDGSEAIVPFCVEKGTSGYTIHITDVDIDNLGYKSVKTVENSVKDNQNQLPRAYGDWKDDYTFDYLYSTIYGQDTFSVNQKAILIEGYQANYMLESGWQKEAEVIYSVVVKHWYGDSVWATTSNAIKKNGSFSITIVGDNSSESDLRIRISNQTGTDPRSKGYGSLYSVSV
ncbi:MAG: hypothetical protein K2O29_00945 [Ruminococcus sp.]|nr:hypothetical protein [Ruminococcus sp.]